MDRGGGGEEPRKGDEAGWIEEEIDSRERERERERERDRVHHPSHFRNRIYIYIYIIHTVVFACCDGKTCIF